ncbi:MAG: ABC transporter ATP-binding protein [Rhodospirillales bacterium]|nr:MAG: ABC transporter ATP-binding protein [Rhodospirillales bacterium]
MSEPSRTQLRERSPQRGAAVIVDDVHLRLTSTAGEVNILRGIDLRVDAGEAVGLIGPSGSGKTSLLMLIAGLERATAGHIRVADTTLTGLDEDALASFRGRHIGIVFQSFHLVPTMTALENVALPLEFAGRRDAFGRARSQLEAVGLGHRLDHYPSQLSGGEQQRVALARAFVVEPALLLADEPTGNLDQATGEAVIDVLFRMHHEHGTTLILVTHETALASRCRRIVRMADGRIADDDARPEPGRPQALFAG